MDELAHHQRQIVLDRRESRFGREVAVREFFIAQMRGVVGADGVNAAFAYRLPKGKLVLRGFHCRITFDGKPQSIVIVAVEQQIVGTSFCRYLFGSQWNIHFKQRKFLTSGDVHDMEPGTCLLCQFHRFERRFVSRKFLQVKFFCIIS